MNSAFVIGGCAFLLLGVVLLVAAAVVFAMSRRRAPAAVAARPAPAAPPPNPAPRPAAPRVTPPPPPHDADATVVTGPEYGALHCDSGPLAGQSFAVDATGFYIGRDRAQAQVVIDDRRVSKRHVWIGVRNGEPVAIDQSSTNGTFLNSVDAPISEARLQPGDTLILPEELARFTYRR